jgi:hypothetical protein
VAGDLAIAGGPCLGTAVRLDLVKVPPALLRNSGGGEDAKLKAITDTRMALLAGLVRVGALLTFWLNSRVYRITAAWRLGGSRHSDSIGPAHPGCGSERSSWSCRWSAADVLSCR